MGISAAGEKVILNFGWQGPSSWHGGSSHGGLDVGVIDLVFKSSTTRVSVSIPDNISPGSAQKLPFTCRRFLAQETHPDSLKVTAEQILNLTIKAGIFEESPRKGAAIMDSRGQVTREKHILRSDREIELERPEELEAGQTYSLVVTSDDFSLSARLLKEDREDPIIEDEKKASKDESQNLMRKMGEALIKEGMQNLDLASKGGAGVFNSSSTLAEAFAHGMRGVIRAGQQINAGFRVPHTRPLESPSNLDMLTTEELQSLFEAAITKDKELEAQRMKAALAGNIEDVNKNFEEDLKNSQFLINLTEALERRGIEAQMPQSTSFQSAAAQAAQANDEAIKSLEAACVVQ